VGCTRCRRRRNVTFHVVKHLRGGRAGVHGVEFENQGCAPILARRSCKTRELQVRHNVRQPQAAQLGFKGNRSALELSASRVSGPVAKDPAEARQRCRCIVGSVHRARREAEAAREVPAAKLVVIGGGQVAAWGAACSAWHMFPRACAHAAHACAVDFEPIVGIYAAYTYSNMATPLCVLKQLL